MTIKSRTKDRVEFPIYACTQGIPSHTRYAFEIGEEGESVFVGDGRWHKYGTLTAPAGSRVIDTDAWGERVLLLPGGFWFSAHDAVHFGRRHLALKWGCGLRIGV